MSSVKDLAAWRELVRHRLTWDRLHLRELFERDPERAARFTVHGPGFLFDYSRHLVMDTTLTHLVALARQMGVERWRARLFNGEVVNHTEQRAALHVALRAAPSAAMLVKGEDVRGLVRLERDRIRGFTSAVHAGAHMGVSGKRFTDVINLGIGGSHLGPELVVRALETTRHPKLRCHFVANVDPLPLMRLMERLDPETTLVIVASKTFTTAETLANAELARRWLEASLGEAGLNHMVAVTAAPDKAREWGIAGSQTFRFWDWVGGRYSVWSAVGLPIALAFGAEIFEQMLEGGQQMDAHFLTAPLEHNTPVLMALFGMWYADFFEFRTQAVVPYREGLASLPLYLQQLEMESNGKRVTRAGEPIDYPTAPVIWGTSGTNGQHAYFQALHQGTQAVPVDLILPLDPHSAARSHERVLAANCLAQAEALALGQTEEEAAAKLRAQGVSVDEIARLAPHQVFPGNRPSSMLVFDRFDAHTIGMLIALYEHKVFVQSCLWDTNAFDQMGVELGKGIARDLEAAFDRGDSRLPTAQYIAERLGR
jgi:glucose-6-phosphate isomerase